MMLPLEVCTAFQILLRVTHKSSRTISRISSQRPYFSPTRTLNAVPLAKSPINIQVAAIRDRLLSGWLAVKPRQGHILVCQIAAQQGWRPESSPRLLSPLSLFCTPGRAYAVHDRSLSGLEGYSQRIQVSYHTQRCS